LCEQHRLTAELQQRNEELQHQAATDPLTGLANRRLLDEALQRELCQSSRQNSRVSLLLLDIDHFKVLNDTYGHQAGDLALRKVAGVVRQMIRKSDVCARFGGEEFAVILPFTDEAGARLVAERMRSGVDDLVMDWEGTRLRVAVSVGGVTVAGSDTAQTAVTVVRAADEALYRAKEEGRNRICWHATCDR